MTELTWSTSADWDNGQSDSGTVHESVTNTDHSDESIVKKGYRIASPRFPANLTGYYPLHEDSGSTAYDFSGNNNDGTINGATVGVTGLLGTTAYSFDGNNDYIQLPFSNGTGAWTLSAWIKIDDSTADGTIISGFEDSGGGFDINHEGGNGLYLRTQLATGTITTSGRYAISAGTWYHVVGRWTGTGEQLIVNGTQQASDTSAHGASSVDFVIGDQAAGSQAIPGPWPGDIWEARLYNESLSDTNVQTLYDVVATQAVHKTLKKTS